MITKYIYWKIFHKNWKSPEILIDYLISKGFVLIGQGWYSVVYSHPSSSYVVKINCGDFDYGYAYYIDICLRYSKLYKNLPSVIKYKRYDFNKNPFYFVLLPKYKPYHTMTYETKEITNIRNNLLTYCPILSTVVDTTLYEFDICKENILIDEQGTLILSDIILSTRNR